MIAGDRRTEADNSQEPQHDSRRPVIATTLTGSLPLIRYQRQSGMLAVAHSRGHHPNGDGHRHGNTVHLGGK